MKYKRRGGLRGLGLDSFFSDAKNVGEEVTRVSTDHINASCIGVIRTKGGSGERHLVEKLTSDHIGQGTKVLVASIFEIPGQNAIKSLDQLVARLENNLLFVEDDGDCARVIVDWTRTAELNKLLRTINNVENLVTIFTVGTASGGGIHKRVHAILPYCNKIYLSVAIDVFNSVDPAHHYILGIQQTETLDKLTVGCWSPKRELTLVPANVFGEFIAENTSYSFD